MGVKIREKRGRLYLDVYWNGRRYWESLKITVSSDPQSRKEAFRLAEKIRAKREFQLVSGDHGLIDPIAGKKPIVEFAEEMADDMPKKNAIPKCLLYLREYASNIQIGAVTERWLEGYQVFLKSQDKLGTTTQAKYYSAVVQVLNRAVRDRIIPRNPATAVKGMKIPEVQKVYLSSSELSKLARFGIGGVLGAEVRKAFLFSSMTGLRKSDLESLKWGDVDRDKLQISKRQNKTGRIVTVPLHEAAWSIINDRSLHNRDELVFPRLTQSKANTNQYIKSWAEKAGIDKPIGWHTARHTFAVLTLEGGADFYTVSKLLGHTKVATTAVYAKATDRMKRKAVDGLPNILGAGKVHA